MDAIAAHLAASYTACHHRQYAHLQLMPWQSTPSEINADEIESILARGPLDHRDYGAAKLLSRMLAAGISQCDPAPLDAIKGAHQ